MSSVFSKNKEKRGRSSSGESNSSFVKNVTSRVSGLLPATITKWFSSPSSSSANGSTPTADATDSSTEDEAPESPVITQPPAKRMRYSPSGSKFPHNVPETSVNIETSETISTSVLYNTIQPGRNTFRREPNFISTPIRSPNDDTNERSERDVAYKSPLPVSVLGQSVAPKRKSIFDLKKTESLNACAKTAANTSKDPKQPYFKPSLLGSPFYPGRTMYGGASTSTYINQPNIRQRKVAQVNESKDNETVNMSYSARQVMDLLENFSSPLSEARRIPIMPRKPINNSIDYDQTSKPSTSKGLTYKTQELHVPNIASILRLKQRSRLMDTTKVARQIIASHSSTLSSFQPYATDTTARKEENTDKAVNILEKEPAQSKTTSKLKSRLTRRNRGEESCTENDTAETIHLPPAAILQIDKDNLPKFSFGVSLASTPTSKNQKTTFTQTPTSPELTYKSSEKPTVNEMFKFSSPVKISLDSHQGDVSFPSFTFGSPERSVDKIESAKKNVVPVISTSSKTDTVLENGDDWKCSDCWVTNKANSDKCVCCGAKQPTKHSSEKINKVESKLDLGNFTPLTKPKGRVSSTWSCPDCWVSNRDTDDKCVCCGSRNPVKSAVAAIPKSTESAEKDWKCDDCWISNKSSVDKCAACGGAKPGTKNNTGATPLPLNSVASNMFSKPSNQFNEIVKSQKGNDKWECPTCLVSNTSENNTCVCCGTDKSGGAKETTKQLFNFNTNANTSFKFGIDPKAQEANIQKKLEDTPKPAFAKTLEESETNNNVVPKIPTFTFSLPTPKSDDKVDASKLESPKPTFTFGIHKPIESSSTIAPFAIKLPEPLKPTEEKEDKEKPQEVPKIEFKLPVQEAPKPSTGYFASPSLPSVKPFDQPAPSFGSFVNTTTEKKEKESSATTIVLSTESKIEKSPMTSSFTFSTPGIKSVNMFSTPASTAATSTGITFGTPLQTAPTTTSSPSLSLFQKPETTTTPTLSIFQKSESISSTPSAMFQASGTTTSAPSAAASAAPLFSFGSNTQSAAPAAAPAPDKPSFNFTFGSNANTENQSSVFKPAFSSTTDNSTNKFALPSPMGNSLGGNNALGTGNLLTGSNLGTNNSMTGNPLSGGNDSNVLSGLQTGNGMSATPSVFGSPMQKENMWGSNNTAASNVFGTSGSSNNMPKAAPFTFGTPTPFNSGNSTSSGQPVQGMFGSNTQPIQNVFGMPSGNTNQPPMFGSQTATPSPPMFGTQSPTPAMPMFGSSSAPAFGTANPSIPSFKTPTMPAASTPAPAFNFGQPQTTGIFGFGQSTPTATPQNAGMYNFGSAAGGPGVGAPGAGPGAPQGLQFSVGSAPNTTVRRVRKAVRRNPQR